MFSGLMMFVLRYRSLRSFCLENKSNAKTMQNFKRWITIDDIPSDDIPSDDDLRYVLQTVLTKNMNKLLQLFHQRLERKKILKTQKLFGMVNYWRH